MTTLDGLYLALILAVLVLGALAATVLWQVSVLVASLRSSMLPQIQALLDESRKSLVHVESITQDVEHKLERLDETVADVNATTHSVAQAARFFSDGVARPFLIGAATLLTGAGAAWKRYRELRRERHAEALPDGSEAKILEEVRKSG